MALWLPGSSWSRVGVVPGSEAGGDGGVGGDAATPARSWASSGVAALARTDSTASVRASMTGGGAAELTPASVSRAAAVKEATPLEVMIQYNQNLNTISVKISILYLVP
ncbi:hypothetical protein Pcinc_003260 [Petrolisthes cinctipes]|uniref:Uncharacterized protein n=1 Tax=Petrolisthes cinctipes TaxID=88211 RepID=A0AAE1GJN9_PETCI|nr:hypothetical protein Pcinc_003260 [Petrolisthes cinctipes]